MVERFKGIDSSRRWDTITLTIPKLVPHFSESSAGRVLELFFEKRPEFAGPDGRVRERFAGSAIAITRDPVSGAFVVEAAPEIEIVEAYWFAWMAFHPGSSVYRASPESPTSARNPETGTAAQP